MGGMGQQMPMGTMPMSGMQIMGGMGMDLNPIQMQMQMQQQMQQQMMFQQQQMMMMQNMQSMNKMVMHQQKLMSQQDLDSPRSMYSHVTGNRSTNFRRPPLNPQSTFGGSQYGGNTPSTNKFIRPAQQRPFSSSQSLRSGVTPDR